MPPSSYALFIGAISAKQWADDKRADIKFVIIDNFDRKSRAYEMYNADRSMLKLNGINYGVTTTLRKLTSKFGVMMALASQIWGLMPDHMRVLFNEPKSRQARQPRQARQAGQARQPQQARQAGQLRERHCKNEITIIGDKTIDIPESKLYIAPSGNCFNVSEDLFGHIMAGNNTDPYTQGPLWTNRAEMLVLLEHPGWTPEERKQLSIVLLSPLRPEVVDILSRSPLFTELYNVGAILFSDYTADFRLSSTAIVRFIEQLDKAGPDGTMILNLRERRSGNSETVKEILHGAAGSCIHGVGLRLLRFYLDLWHMIPESQRPPLPKTVGQPAGTRLSLFDQIVKTVTLATVNDKGRDLYYVLLYIFDMDNMGQQSYLWYFMEEDFSKAIKEGEIPIPPAIKDYWMQAVTLYRESGSMRKSITQTMIEANKLASLLQKPKIVILQSKYDPVGSFDKGGDKGLIEVFNRIEKFDVKHAYIGSVHDIDSILFRNFTESGPIAHLVIMAHGNASDITLSSTNRLASYLDYIASIIKSTLAPKASIFLHSCAVGQGSKSIAEHLSIQSGRTVWGAEQNIHRGDVLVTKITVHDDYLDIIYDIDNDQVKSQGRRPYRMLEFSARQQQTQ